MPSFNNNFSHRIFIIQKMQKKKLNRNKYTIYIRRQHKREQLQIETLFVPGKNTHYTKCKEVPIGLLREYNYPSCVENVYPVFSIFIIST